MVKMGANTSRALKRTEVPYKTQCPLFGKLFELFEYISVHFGSTKCPPQSGALSGRKCTPHFRFEPPQPPTQGPWGVQEEPRPLALVPGSPGPRLGTQGALGLPEKAQARGA